MSRHYAPARDQWWWDPVPEPTGPSKDLKHFRNLVNAGRRRHHTKHQQQRPTRQTLSLGYVRRIAFQRKRQAARAQITRRQAA